MFGWFGRGGGGLKALMLRDVHDLWHACTYMRVGGVCGFVGGSLFCVAEQSCHEPCYCEFAEAAGLRAFHTWPMLRRLRLCWLSVCPRHVAQRCVRAALFALFLEASRRFNRQWADLGPHLPIRALS